MGAPLLLADNLLSVIQYPNHILTDQSGTVGVTGNEVWRVGQGRRSLFSFWQPGSTNLDTNIRLTCNRVRGANCFILERGHNMTGLVVRLYGSQDAFVTNRPIVVATIPTAGGDISGPNGVTTEEGAWIITFPTEGFTSWMPFFPAMGVGLQPNIVGAYLGMAYQPIGLYRPYPEHPTQLVAQESLSPVGWRGRGPRAFNRAGTFELRMDTLDEYELARFTVEELYGSGHPMWVIQDTDLATQAFCAIRPLGAQGFARPINWAFPIGSFQFVEHEPLPL